MRPRRKYAGEEFHKIVLEQQHKTFIISTKNNQKSKERQAYYTNKNAKEITFQIGDPVYIKNHARKTKLQTKCSPHYRIIEQKSPVTFIVKNQLDGTTSNINAKFLKPANLEWTIPKPQVNDGRPARKSTFVCPYDADTDNDNDNDDRQY